jgi:predicted PurR-regulated permease PerM
MAELLAAVQRHRLALFAIFMIALLAWLLWAARGAMAAFFVGLALAFILDPGVTLAHRRGVPRWLGILVSYVVFVGLVWLLVAFAVPPIGAQTRSFIEHLPELGATVREIEQAVVGWYEALPLPPDLRAAISEQLVASQQAIGDLLRGLLAPTLTAIFQAATFILGLVVVPVWLFFVLKDRESFPHAVAGALPPAWRPDVENLLSLLGRVGGKWVRGQLLLGASVFTATAIGLGILTLIGFSQFGDFLLVLALIAGVLEWFPVIGPIIASVPAILIGISISPYAALAAVILYTGIQQLENNLLVPKVMGDAIELHPAVLIVALVAGGALFGLGGAILAAPTVAAGRDLYRYGFQRLSGQPPAPALELALHGARAIPHPADATVLEPDSGDEPAPSIDATASDASGPTREATREATPATSAGPVPEAMPEADPPRERG